MNNEHSEMRHELATRIAEAVLVHYWGTRPDYFTDIYASREVFEIGSFWLNIADSVIEQMERLEKEHSLVKPDKEKIYGSR